MNIHKLIHNNKQHNYKLAEYSYELPHELIAQEPSIKRNDSRLLVLDRNTGEIQPNRFNNLLKWLPKGSLIVVNNSKVFPARIRFSIGGKECEFFMLTPLNLVDIGKKNDGRQRALVQGLLRPVKKININQEYTITEDVELVVTRKYDFGKVDAELIWCTGVSLEEIFQRFGKTPLPPYIKREVSSNDMDRYQTVFSKNTKIGSVAAPTAGLHFSKIFLKECERAGHELVEITLYVGYGTFSPIREDDIRNHTMHAEYVEIDEKASEALIRAKHEGRSIIAVGTTVTRALEGVHHELERIDMFAGWINLYIVPGFTFKVVDHLITNFHLPKSSLLVLVSSFADSDLIKKAYERAVEERFKFYSYGDAMLIL